MKFKQLIDESKTKKEIGDIFLATGEIPDEFFSLSAKDQKDILALKQYKSTIKKRPAKKDSLNFDNFKTNSRNSRQAMRAFIDQIETKGLDNWDKLTIKKYNELKSKM